MYNFRTHKSTALISIYSHTNRSVSHKPWWDSLMRYLGEFLGETTPWDNSVRWLTWDWHSELTCIEILLYFLPLHPSELYHLTTVYEQPPQHSHQDQGSSHRINIHRYIQPLSLFVSELIQPSPDWGWSDVIHWSLSYLSLSRRALPPLIHLSLTGAGVYLCVTFTLLSLLLRKRPSQREVSSEWFHWEKDGNPLVTSQWLMDSSPE